MEYVYIPIFFYNLSIALDKGKMYFQLVDGCISQDSDCFLYGAKIVYRNFSMGNCRATGGSMDVYSMEKVKKTLNIGRNKMIALALLCGCDYDDGVSGVGKEAALKFFKTVKEEDVLQRFDIYYMFLSNLSNFITTSKLCFFSAGFKIGELTQV